MALSLLSASYLAVGEETIYFTGPSATADAGEADGTPCQVIWVDRGKRRTQRRQAKMALSGTKSTVQAVTVGRQGVQTFEFTDLPFALYALFKASSNTNERGTLHVVHQVDTEDLDVEWWDGMEWQDRPFEYEGDPIPNFRISLWSHGNAEVP